MVNFLQKWFWRTVILALFIVSLIYVLLQANGFQFDTYTNQFRRTGIIDVAYSNPRAVVYLDGQKLNGTLPFVATNVLPGEYNLVVAEEGYWDYQTLVKVSPDLISRIKSVFLAPMYRQSKLIWEENWSEQDFTLLKGGYLFWQNEKMLKWAKLDENQLDFLSVQLSLEKLQSVEVYTGEAVLTDIEGHRGILDLNSAYFQAIQLDDHYTYIGERWLFFQGDVLVLFDRKINRIIWARQPKLGREITALRYFNSLNREFIAIDFVGELDGILYELKTNNLVMIDQGQVNWVAVNQEGQIDYIKDARALWSYSPKETKANLLFRFLLPVEMITADWSAFGSKGVLLFKDADGYWLSDRLLENSRLIFTLDEAEKLLMQPNGYLYYYVRQVDEGKQLLYLWNIED